MRISVKLEREEEMEEIFERVMQYEKAPRHLRQTVYEEMRHGVEVSNLAKMIAEEMGEPKEVQEELEIAGILHDIGKLKLTKYMYSEDGLIVEQMKYVRQHTKQSFEIVKAAGYGEEISKAVYYHHENCDGSGYPDNLQKNEIPPLARILRVCDVFIALTTDRSYRKAFDPKTALEIMIDEVQDYDMNVFLAFQRVLHHQVFPLGMEQMRAVTSEKQYEVLEVFVREMEYLC